MRRFDGNYQSKIGDFFGVTADEFIGKRAIRVEVELLLEADEDLANAAPKDGEHAGLEAVPFLGLLDEAGVDPDGLEGFEDLGPLVLGDGHRLPEVPVNVEGVAGDRHALRQRQGQLALALPPTLIFEVDFHSRFGEV